MSKEKLLWNYEAYPHSQNLCLFWHLKMSISGNKTVSDMTDTVHVLVASVNIPVLMLVLMPVLISQVWTRLKRWFLPLRGAMLKFLALPSLCKTFCELLNSCVKTEGKADVWWLVQKRIVASTMVDKLPWDTCVIALIFGVFRTEF